MVVNAELCGQVVTLLNGGPAYQLTTAFFPLSSGARTRPRLTGCGRRWARGGRRYNVCGWLTDKFGLTWQINYAGLPELMTGANAGKSDHVMAAMMTMAKIDIQKLKDATT